MEVIRKLYGWRSSGYCSWVSNRNFRSSGEVDGLKTQEEIRADGVDGNENGFRESILTLQLQSRWQSSR